MPDAPSLSRRRLTLILGTLAALGPFSIDMYLPSFPTLARSLGTTVSAVELTLATYLAGLAVGQFLYGPLADRFGRKLPLLGGISLYVLASLACAAAPSLELLAAARFVQALGGCAGMVISRAVVRDNFDERGSAELYSSLMLVMGAAPILAPLVGGQLLAFAGWRAIFVTLAGIGAAMFVLVLTGLPESLAPAARTKHGFSVIVRNVGGLLQDLRFVRTAIAGGAMQAAMFAYIAGSPFVFIELFRIPPERYGFFFGANALGLIGASQLNRWIVPKMGVMRTLRAAILVASIAFAALFVAADAGAGAAVLLPLIFVGISMVGLVLPNATAAAMAPFGKQAGVASALLGTLQMICAASSPTAVSALADGTARPMAAVMLACAVVALASGMPIAWPRPRTA